MRPRILAMLSTFVLVCSGCVGGSGSSDSSPNEAVQAAPPPEVDAHNGAIEGTVTDDAVNPIAGAQVGLIGTEFLSLSDAAGRFSISKVPPGSYKFAANRLGYSDFVRAVDVRPGEVTPVTVQLVPLAIDEAYHVTQRGDGRMGCAAAVKPGTAIAVCAAGYGTPLDALDHFRVDFSLTANVTSRIQMLVFDTEWRSNQVLSSGFDVYWESFQDWGTGTTYTEEVRRFARAFGKSPLNTTADNDAIKAVAKKKPDLKYCKWDTTCKLYARAFPYAMTTGQSVDVSLYVDQPFTHYVTEFFGDLPPADFTALADK
ncbi:MAG TPA: carboxypeptidase-like regulatory domain-containing protein [Candidatus Thermoplasmatota archaeon]|nr:carboxypeptidase-like regulatory domain-containing protein [Candidatus Thermoplasmatota archaeon]